MRGRDRAGGGMTRDPDHAAPAAERPRPRGSRPGPARLRRSASSASSLALVAAGRRHRAGQPAVPVRAEHQGPAARPDDPGDAGRRPGHRRHHPQRRPVGRLGPRPVSAFATGDPVRDHPGLPIVVAAGRGMASARRAGWSTACWSRFGRVPALVVTLGTLYVFRGIDYIWAGGQQINAADMPPALPAAWATPACSASRSWRCSPLVVLVVGRLLPAQLPRRPRAVRDRLRPGGRPAGRHPGRPRACSPRSWSAARSPAWPACCTRPGSARVDANAGIGYELNVVAAVVVGGVAIFGGSGTVYGAALGALLLTTIGSALPVLGINPFWQQAVVGALILARHRRSTGRWSRCGWPASLRGEERPCR